MLSSWIGWHQGEVLSISNLLVSTGLGSTCLRSQVSTWWGFNSYKNNLSMVIALSVFFLEFILMYFLIFWPHHMACESLVPNQGSNLCPLHWKCRVLTTGLPGKSLQKLLSLMQSHSFTFAFASLGWGGISKKILRPMSKNEALLSPLKVIEFSL